MATVKPASDTSIAIDSAASRSSSTTSTWVIELLLRLGYAIAASSGAEPERGGAQLRAVAGQHALHLHLDAGLQVASFAAAEPRAVVVDDRRAAQHEASLRGVHRFDRAAQREALAGVVIVVVVVAIVVVVPV